MHYLIFDILSCVSAPILPGASLNGKSLHEAGITHTVNWSPSARCNVFDDIEYMCFKNIEGRGSVAFKYHLAELDKAVEFVESVRVSGGKVLSHCW